MSCSYYRTQLQMDVVDSAYYGQLRHWLSARNPNQWAEDVYWGVDGNGEPIVKSFRY